MRAFILSASPLKLFAPSPRSITHLSHPPRFSMATQESGPSLGDRRVLFAKAGPDLQLGDCPFTHKANLALRFRGVDFDVYPVDLGDKPQWFLDLNDAGSTPVFVDGTHAIADSDDIIEYADKQGSPGAPRLVREDDARWDAAFDAVSPIFGAFVRLLKNEDDAEEDGLKGKLADALEQLDDFLGSTEGAFLLGNEVCALDCNLGPKLHHMELAAGHYKKFEIPAECKRVREYLQAIRETDEWKASVCADDVVLWGWSKLFS